MLAGLTAQSLADGAGWHRTKVSKLEHGATSPTAADIQVWCELCGVPGVSTLGAQAAGPARARVRTVGDAVELARERLTGLRAGVGAGP